METRSITIELTSKAFKLHKALAVITYLIGVVILVSGLIGLGLLLILVGLVWKWITEARIYWNHA